MITFILAYNLPGSNILFILAFTFLFSFLNCSFTYFYVLVYFLRLIHDGSYVWNTFYRQTLRLQQPGWLGTRFTIFLWNLNASLLMTLHEEDKHGVRTAMGVSGDGTSILWGEFLIASVLWRRITFWCVQQVSPYSQTHSGVFIFSRDWLI